MRKILLALFFLLSCDAKGAPLAPLPASPISPSDIQSWKDIRKKAKEAQVLGKSVELSPAEQVLLGHLFTLAHAHARKESPPGRMTRKLKNCADRKTRIGTSSMAEREKTSQ